MNNIKAIRKEQGISVTELAEKLNMSQGNLSKIENNQIDLKPEIALKIAEALGVSVQAVQSDISTTKGLTEFPLINPEALSLPPLSRLSFPTTYGSFSANNTTSIFVQTDDTMSPLIPLNALVLIDKSNKSVSNGIFLIKIDNIVYLRRLQPTFTSDICIICDNPSYTTQHIDISSIEIIGQARSYFSITTI